MKTATVEPQKEAEISNIIFEWVDFLYENKDRIERYDKTLNKIKALRNEAYSLKPKNAYLDDTAYKRKINEGQDYFENSWLRIRKEYLDKFSELGFIEKYGTYKNSLKSILDTWNSELSDKSIVRKQLTDCKKKYYQLQTDKIRLFYEEFNNEFFKCLDYVLTATFDKVLGNKYQALADELKPYLEQYDANVIESIIDSKHLPYGAEKPIWRKQADAHAFRAYMEWELKDINRLFRFRNRKSEIIDKTNHNTKSKEPNSDLLAILTKYIIK